MSTLPSTFAVFILTHGRPGNVITAETLARCGYSGRLYIVVDDTDTSLPAYRARFANVVVFDKEAEAALCDEGNNFGARNVILMARNACFRIAEQLGVTHFVELDDDYYYFGYRFAEGARRIRNMDAVFAALLRYYESVPQLATLAMSQGGDHIGGFDGVRVKRKAMNSFLCSTERPFRFVGALNEDVNTYATLGARGALFFTFTGLQLDQKDTQAQDGGITDTYRRFGTFVKSFTTVTMAPNAVSVAMMGQNPRLHHHIEWAKAVPCIVPEIYRKEREEVG